MDSTVKVPTPAEMCQARASGLTTLLSIGGAPPAVRRTGSFEESDN
jgi:hypothetical protein